MARRSSGFVFLWLYVWWGSSTVHQCRVLYGRGVVVAMSNRKRQALRDSLPGGRPKFRSCRPCKGLGKMLHGGEKGPHWHKCAACNGTGHEPRVEEAVT